MKNGDKPAHPVECSFDEDGTMTGVRTGEYTGFSTGLTKREYFAAMAMQGILSRAGNWNDVKDYSFVYNESLRHADGLLKQLEA